MRLGSGLGEYKTSRPGVLFGTLNPIEETGRSKVMAVCDDAGQIEWFDSKDLFVVTIDGRDPAIVLAEAQAVESRDVTGSMSDDDIQSLLDAD